MARSVTPTMSASLGPTVTVIVCDQSGSTASPEMAWGLALAGRSPARARGEQRAQAARPVRDWRKFLRGRIRLETWRVMGCSCEGEEMEARKRSLRGAQVLYQNYS